MIEGNLIIKASAGTGKTFSLATRFIRLMRFGRVEPERIIALTFSRAAAQEIYTKILERLWEAASSEAGAEKERANLLDGLSAAARQEVERVSSDWSPASFARQLRKLINTQHLGAIATLDSFILRIVGNFPLELGFQNAVEVLDVFGETEALKSAVKGMLVDAAATESVARTFRTVEEGKFSRACLSDINEVLIHDGWRNFVLVHRDAVNWTVESMAAALGVDTAAKPPRTEAQELFTTKNDPAGSLLKHATAFTGEGNFFATDKTKALMQWFNAHPDATEFSWTTKSGKEIIYPYDAAQLDAIHAAIKYLTDAYLTRQLKIVVAKIRLVTLMEAEYHRATRRTGKLTFQDFTEYSAAQEGSERELALQNVEFRFDSKFDHWALDEFQDTSEVQWRCLNRLVRSAADGAGGRTVLAVGDQKQSIYTWRGASHKPFDELLSWPEFQSPLGNIASIDKSYRYGRYTAEFINRVFGRDNALIDCDEWRAGWPDHSSVSERDYVKVVTAAPDVDIDCDDAILPALARELQAVWEAHQAAKSVESVGVLVRSNGKGAMVAEYLRAHHLPVVWEGMNDVHDLPAVQGVLQLLRLSAHPEDTLAWKTVNELLPKIGALLKDCPTAEAASRRVAEMLSRLGLSRTVREFANGLSADAAGLDELSRERLAMLVRLAVDYEGRPGAETDADGFVRFLESSSSRELGVSSDVIRILTIHRSKGLTLDRVFVPLFECGGDESTLPQRWRSAIDRPKVHAPLFAEDGDWVLQRLDAGVEAFNVHTQAAYREMCRERLLENLRTYYVALTRGRNATYVIFPRDTRSSSDQGLLVRDLVLKGCKDFEPRPIVDGQGADLGEIVYEAGTVPPFKRPVEQAKAGAATDEWTLGAGVVPPRRSTPSGALNHDQHGFAAAAIFADGYGAAATRGVEVHRRYAAVEWADAAALAAMPAAFREAFTQRDAGDRVWRERSYELFVDNRWETGQFDRVVFRGGADAAGRTATIYDFKTNSRRAAETEKEFARRMENVYAGQMRSYRAALARLTGIAPARINAVLLLESIAAAVPVRFS